MLLPNCELSFLAMMYMNKYDFGAEKNGTKLAAFKLWNLNFKAAPKAGVVSKDILA
jgi:hypothetical protein